MTDRRGVWAGCLVALAGACAPAVAQLGTDPKPPRRIADGNWAFDGGGTCGKAEAARRMMDAADEDPLGTLLSREASTDTDLLNVALDVEIVPTSSTSGTIAGSNTFTLQSKVNGLTQFTFRLRSQFVISSAVINGTTPVSVTNPTTTTRIATLDRAYAADEVFTLTITYSGVPQSIGSFGSVNFDTQNGLPLFQTLSEPYYAYTWWPCKDGDTFVPGDNSDKFTAQVSITAPDTMVSVSNGLLQGIDVLSGSRKRYRWATNTKLCTYLLAICSTPYNQWSQTYSYPLPGGGTGTMPVQFSIYPGNDNATNRAAWEKTLVMMATYRPYYGEYPFTAEKYGVYNFNFSGGEEHQTYTGEGTFDESVTSHELGHQWWGDNVTAKYWNDIWLNEGFATFTESLWEQYKPGSTGWPQYFAALQARRPSAVAESVYRTDLSSAAVIFSTAYSYKKPGWVLHTLRGVVGDATFWNILATYRSTFQGSAATTDDFKNIASQVCGQDMTWFFQEWIYGPGAPAYASGWQTFNVNGQNYLRMHIRQTQVGTYPVFTMPISVRIGTSLGPQYVKVWNNGATEWYVVPIPAPATALLVDRTAEGTSDPSPWILWTSNTAETYRPGPPKVIQSLPAPGAVIPAASAPSQLGVTFSENVSAPSAAFTLTGPGGSMPVNVTYSSTNFSATLDAGVTLSPGTYTVSVQDTVTSVAAGTALDGETGNAPPPAPPRTSAFPTGDGQPGGVATWTFTVQGASCYPNCDGSTAQPVLNVADFTCFLQRYAAGDAYANCDGSTAPPVLNVADFTCFLQTYASGCR